MASIPRTLPKLLSMSTNRFLPATIRYNSTSSTSSVASRVADVSSRVASAEKPSALEASVPVMWALSGAAILTAWSRMDGGKEDYVEKLLIV